MRFKKILVALISVSVLFLVAFIFSNKGNKNTNVSQNNNSSSDIIYNDNDIEDDNSSELEKINTLVVDFLKAYYNIHSDDNSKNYALQHFEEYKIYMTEKCQAHYKPKEVSQEQDQNIGYSYNLDLTRYKIYSDIDFIEEYNETRVLCFIQTRTQLGDIKPNISTALLNLELKKENGKWLVDDIIINQLVDFPINLNDLFS